MMHKAEGKAAAPPDGMDLFAATDGFLAEIKERARSQAAQTRVRGFVWIMPATMVFSCTSGGCSTSGCA